MWVTLFFSVSRRNFSHFILGYICFAQCVCVFFFFAKHHEWFMTFWRHIPQDYIRNSEKQVIEPNFKKPQTFPKWISSWLQSVNSFWLTTSALSFQSAPHFCDDPPDFLSLLTAHYDQLSLFFPAMSRNVQFSQILPFSLKVNFAAGLQNSLIGLVNDWTKTLIGVIAIRLVISFNHRIIGFQSLQGPGIP